jgi:hypothetical protein
MRIILIGMLALDGRQGSRNGSDRDWDHSFRMETYGQFMALRKKEGNERQLWHGTGRVCNLGDPGNTTPCANRGCALCSIVRGSFDVSKVTAYTGWARFGAGIYTTSRSSKWV